MRLLQLASYLKVPINYFFDNYSEYLNNLDKTAGKLYVSQLQFPC